MSQHDFNVLRTVVFAMICSLGFTASGNSQSALQLQKGPEVAKKARASHAAQRSLESPVSKAEVDELRKAIADEHQQAEQRLDVVERENRRLAGELRSAAEKLAEAGEEVGRLHAAGASQIDRLEGDVIALKTAEAGMATFEVQEKKLEQARQNPVSLRYRGISIAPGGFFAAEALYRTRAENADINTTWASIPYSAQSMAHLTEFRATARQTRLTLRADGAVGRVTLTGYFETDFLASGFGASEVQTNGYSNRVRQMWGRVQFENGWTFAGGQMWSLVTTNRVGIENLTEMTPALIDATVLPGFDYARQNAFRVTKRWEGNKLTVAFAAENAATVGVTPPNVPASVTSLLSGMATTGPGVMSNTTYSTNVAPDLIAKATIDPGWGHYEIKAMGRVFRDRLNATATMPGRNHTLLGGGIGAAAYVPLVPKKANVLVQGMWGAVGRYAPTSIDVVVKPNGWLSTEKGLHAIAGVDMHPTARLDWYAYAGEEYLPRNFGYGLKTIDNAKCFIENGFSCPASVRNLQAAATGFWFRFYKGPAGTVQYGANYVYVVKETWTGVVGSPRAIENVVESSFRIYLP